LEWIPAYDGDEAPYKRLWAQGILRNPSQVNVGSFSNSWYVGPPDWVDGQTTHAADASGTWRCVVDFYDGFDYLTTVEDTVDVP
jgi:hypothetical protein